MVFWIEMIKREFDTKPIESHLYGTYQCSLDCFTVQNIRKKQIAWHRDSYRSRSWISVILR